MFLIEGFVLKDINYFDLLMLFSQKRNLIRIDSINEGVTILLKVKLNKVKFRWVLDSF